MNWLDILIIVIMAAAIAFGFRVGLIRMLFALAVIAGATVFATLLRQQAADIVGLFIADHNLAALGGYALVLILTIVAGWVVVGLVKTALKALMMGWLDTVGGVVFGAVAGCMLVVAVIWALESFGVREMQEALDVSVLRPYFAFLVPILQLISGEIDLS